MNRNELRFNGWGRTDQQLALSNSQALWKWLAAELGMAALPQTPAPALEQLELPGSRLGQAARDSLAAALPDSTLHWDRFERAFHARGQSYHDLLHYRCGKLEQAPDAVVYPTTRTDTVAALRWAAEHDFAVVPFGGGSSVVGGVTAAGGDHHRGVLTLDTTRLDHIHRIDTENRLAVAEAGIYGPVLEAALQREGVTLGHYPQSFEFSTLGGWIAARGAGQQSNRYGAANRWFASARFATPGGLFHTEDHPASAAGPRLADLLPGSEGLLGVVVDATVHLHRCPAHRDYRGFLFRSFEQGLSAARAISQSGLPLAMLRLSDAEETHFQSRYASFSQSPGIAQRAAKHWLRWRGFATRPCLMLIGMEGETALVKAAVRQLRRLVRRQDGLSLGRSPGQRWYASRFQAPFLRDPLLDRGIGVDTLETATRWRQLPGLYRAVRAALREALGENGMIMAHVSHSYSDGASLYFTFVFERDADDPLAQWRRIKRAASEAIIANGGTISHHHGVGEDHREWLAADKGEGAVAMLKAVTRQLDPAGILNPGKLLSEEDPK